MHLRKLTPLLKAREHSKRDRADLSHPYRTFPVSYPHPCLENSKENLRHPGSSLPSRKRCSPIKEKDRDVRMRCTEARNGKIWGLAESNRIRKWRESHKYTIAGIQLPLCLNLTQAVMRECPRDSGQKRKLQFRSHMKYLLQTFNSW